MNEWMTKWKKKWKSKKFFGIVEYGVVNEFEKKIVWKMEQKSLKYEDMVDWKNPGFEPE